MSAIELAQVGLVDQIDSLVNRIADATAEEAKAAFDRMGVAREWAKLQEDATELAERLVWLEAVILRRIGQLDPKVLPAPRRPAARHFATLDDATLAKLVADYPARTAVSVYNLWAKAQGLRRQRQRGRDRIFGVHDSHVDADEDLAEEVRLALSTRILTVRQAAAVIIDEYATDYRPTVSGVVEAFIEEEMPMSATANPLEVSAFRKGITAAVREAFLAAPVVATERSWEIPAFITTFDTETGEWLRVPSEYATIADARRMLALRKGQVESMGRAYAALEEVMVNRFRVHECDPSDYLRNDATALTRRMVQASRPPRVKEPA